jgi:hypothetical protein
VFAQSRQNLGNQGAWCSRSQKAPPHMPVPPANAASIDGLTLLD